jgi:hypothetical protein
MYQKTRNSQIPVNYILKKRMTMTKVRMTPSEAFVETMAALDLFPDADLHSKQCL